ncbi:MAG TPA: hypothetical protein VIY48_21610 [Candidatus Paceibacterota bacterium]
MTSVLFDKELHRYTDPSGNTRYPSVTEILSDCGLVNFSMVPKNIRDAAMKLGTQVHWMLELEDLGALNYRTVPRALRPYRTAYLTWKKRSGFQPLMIEKSFLSVHGYAGTFDRFGSLPKTAQFPRSFALVDFKSGDGKVADWVGKQLAAYSREFRDMGTVRRIGLQLHKDGTYAVREFPESSFNYDLAVFLQALKQWKEKHAD